MVLLQVDCEKDEGVELAKKYNIRGYPTFYLVNASEEPLFVFMGYGKQYFSQKMALALSDLNPISVKEERFARKPDAELARILADYYFARNELKTAYDYLKKAKNFAQKPDMELDRQIFRIVYSGYRSDQFPLDSVKAAADHLMAGLKDEKSRAQILFNMSRLLAKSPDDKELLSYLTKLTQMIDRTPDLLRERSKKEVELLHCLYVEKDAKKAVEKKKAAMPPGWQENPDQLNSFAWWCFENKINLDEAAALAKKALELADDPLDKANILDTLAEILSLQGKHQEAIKTEEKAIELNPKDKLFKRNLEKFRQRAGVI